MTQQPTLYPAVLNKTPSIIIHLTTETSRQPITNLTNTNIFNDLGGTIHVEVARTLDEYGL